MDFDIETSLKKIDSRYITEMTKAQKKKAIEEFKKLYCQQMAKLTHEIERKKKVQENLIKIEQLQSQGAKQIDQEIKKRMSIHDKKRLKQRQSKANTYKLMEENWKRKLDQIIRKNQQKNVESIKKAQKLRKQSEQYWKRKSYSFSHENEQKNVSSDHNQINKTLNINQTVRTEKKIQLARYTQNINSLSSNVKQSNQKPIKNVNLNSIIKIKNLEKQEQKDIDLLIKIHKQKSLQRQTQKQQYNFQRAMKRLQIIQQKRSSVLKRIQKEVSEAKKVREMKQNPQYLASNRLKSLESIQSKSKKNLNKKSQNKRNSNSITDKARQNISIEKRLEKKRSLEMKQFIEREDKYQQSMRRIKKGRINKMVREVINLIKHQTLKQIE